MGNGSRSDPPGLFAAPAAMSGLLGTVRRVAIRASLRWADARQENEPASPSARIESGGRSRDARSRGLPADHARRPRRAGLGSRRRRLRDRRRLRGSSVLRDGHPRALARAPRLSRRPVGAARLEERRALACPRTAAALLRRERGQHGLDDQSLHGEPEAPQRRRLLTRWRDRPATRPADLGLCPALSRGLQGGSR